MTPAVDWALKNNYLSVNFNLKVTSPPPIVAVLTISFGSADQLTSSGGNIARLAVITICLCCLHECGGGLIPAGLLHPLSVE